MISRSVWYEQVDVALITKIHQILGEDFQVDFRSEDDYIEYEKPIKYPRILITHLGENFERYRYSEEEQTYKIDATKVYKETSAKPYKLKYQLELQTSYILDMNSITLKLCDFFIDWFNLDVIDTSGTPRSIPVKRVIETSAEEKTSDEQRIFKRIYQYDFKVEIDEAQIKEYLRPTKQKINTTL